MTDAEYQKKYGLAAGEYDTILVSQGGVCALCGRPPAKRALAVDHCHACGRYRKWLRLSVRGLLCSNCNRGLFRENPALLRLAAEYFQRHRDICPWRLKEAQRVRS